MGGRGMSIQGEIDRLSAAKASIAASLQSMGVDPPEGTTLEQYAAQLAAIAVSAPWLPLSGGTMTGDITLKDKGFIENAKGTLGFDGVMIGQNNPSSGGSGYARLEVQYGRIIFLPQSDEASKYAALSLNGFNLNGIDIRNCPTIDALKPKTTTVTLTTTGWTQSGERYSQSVSCSIVKTDSPIVLIDAALSGTDLDADAEILNAWAGPSAQKTEQGDGTLTFYSVEVPTVNIPVSVGVIG